MQLYRIMWSRRMSTEWHLHVKQVVITALCAKIYVVQTVLEKDAIEIREDA